MAEHTTELQPAVASETGDSGEQLDDLLQRSRRVDWRFLLPNPKLGSVVYFGPADDPLRDALTHFADAVTDGETVATESQDTFDAVIMRNQPAEMLTRARSLLKPGGTLYVEIQRRVGHDIPWQLGRYGAAAERAGFRQVEAFWNWPSFTRCTKIMSLDDASGLCNVVVNNRQGIAAWLMLKATRLGFRTGIVGWFVPCLSLIARREMS